LAQHFSAAARRDYQILLEDAPEYPGRADIQEKINALGQKLADTQTPGK